jgi:CRISPR-associated endonuclease Cas1
MPPYYHWWCVCLKFRSRGRLRHDTSHAAINRADHQDMTTAVARSPDANAICVGLAERHGPYCGVSAHVRERPAISLRRQSAGNGPGSIGRPSGAGRAVGAYINRQLQERQRTVASDRSAALRIARELIARKLEAARETLSLVVGDNASLATAILTDALTEPRERPPRTLSALHGIEGRSAAAYFAAWRSVPLRWIGTGRHLIPDDWRTIGSRAAAPGEGNRNATHPVNAALNFGYALAESRVRISIATQGLDPAVGFMHGPQRPKQAPRSPLALDLMEPLRPIVDRAVLGFLRERALRPPDFVMTGEGICRLHPQLARVLVATVSQALGERVDEVVSWLVRELQQPAPAGLDPKPLRDPGDSSRSLRA